jgi:hypothetical protein
MIPKLIKNTTDPGLMRRIFVVMLKDGEVPVLLRHKL